MNQLMKRLKPFIRWVILGGTLFFLVAAVKAHWQGVAEIRIAPTGWALLAIALGVTLLAHICSGWVWGWILREFSQSVTASWSVITYLKTNIAKYLPGNVWHFYSRVSAANAAGIPFSVSVVSVVMEPLLMAAAALAVALFSLERSQIWIQILVLAGTLAIVHPYGLNRAIALLSKAKLKKAPPSDEGVPIPEPPTELPKLHRYPWRPLLGEFLFLGLRSIGFVLAIAALQPISWSQVPLLVSVFSFSWLLGLVVPGAPGGLGVFEATAIALLSRHTDDFSTAVIISAVALYRLISILAEAGGAGLAWLDERRSLKSS
ncbi:MAG: flippase-like domain-containing protein [Synechococcales cyanobacterium T60_A2020_003]|nr:flippase-like domain-containing protein [Synechococcales cyanobacterium T60_A2020_003]